MILVGIETSGQTCGVSIWIDGHEVYLKEQHLANVHDKVLAATFLEALNASGATDISSIDAIACSAGPGSFTGLRIGLSFAKGLCIPGDIALISVPTLQAMAVWYGRDDDREIVCSIPSHRGLYYTQSFAADRSANGNVQLLEMDVIRQHLNGARHVVVPEVPLTASAVTYLGSKLYDIQEFVDPLHAEPLYEQDFVVIQRTKSSGISA